MKISHRYPLFAALPISIAKKLAARNDYCGLYTPGGMTITRAADNRKYAETADFKLMTSAFYVQRS